MPQMLGEKVLPESVQQRRRKLRTRVMDLREPVRSRREDLIPGPDLIGKTENQARSIRSRIVGDTNLVDKIRGRRANNPNGSSGSSSSSSGSSSKGPQATQKEADNSEMV